MKPAEHEAHDERLGVLEQELGDFTYIVSHDLTATFRHVKGFLGLLARDLEPNMTERQRDFVSRIDSAADNCHAMLEQLRLYSRIQRQPLQTTACDAADLVDAARIQLVQAVRDSGAQILVGPLEPVRADRALVVDALRRLLDNAMTFRRPDAAPRIEIAQVSDAEDWVVRIVDNGVGVAPAHYEKLFEMFYRLDPNRAGAGVGAGLTISRRIFRRHGGDVRFLDWEGGACVEARLPRMAAAVWED